MRKKCKQCKKEFEGRKNKLFCGEQCANAFHNYKNHKPLPILDKTCPICGTEFKGNYRRKYCSTKCNIEATKQSSRKYYKASEKIESTCLWCHISFKTNFSLQKFCDGDCAVAYRKMEKRIFKLHPFEDTLELQLELAEKGKNFKLR